MTVTLKKHSDVLAFTLFAAALGGCDSEQTDYAFVCEVEGRGLSVVDVRVATGQHQTFLDLLRQYDPEGYDILADPVLADKTIWAPTNEAFSALGDLLSTLPDDEVKAIRGYHVALPRRTPEGPYPIITPEYLTDGGWLVHQTRTGILMGSDQRVLTKMEDGTLTVDESRILPTAWCTQTGSVFVIDTVIIEATPEPWT